MDNDRYDPSLQKLIDLRLYDQWGEMPRSTPEERAMRYSVVCTSMLADCVEVLEEGNESSTKKIAEVEGSMGALEVQQAKLNDKVTLLKWDFTLNLKYCLQVVDFEAQMLSFGLTESVMDHQERVQQDWMVQETFGLHQDRMSGMEEMLRALTTKVSPCSTWVDRLKLTEGFSRHVSYPFRLKKIMRRFISFPISRGIWSTPTCERGRLRRRLRRHGHW